MISAVNVGSDELLGGSSQGNRPPATDPLASRVLAKGEPISAPGGRADDFSWPRTRGVNIDTGPLERTPAAISVSAPAPEKTGTNRGPAAQFDVAESPALQRDGSLAKEMCGLGRLLG